MYDPHHMKKPARCNHSVRLSLIVFAQMVAVNFAAAGEQYNLQIDHAPSRVMLPSASGIAVLEDRVYVEADDSPWLFTVDDQFRVIERSRIKDWPTDENERITKAIKPDLESMAAVTDGGADFLILLGSGSKPKIRETGFVVSDDGAIVHETNMQAAYAELKTAAKIDELNLEGLAVADGDVFMLNRINGGGNFVFRVGSQQFRDYMFGRASTLGEVEAFKLKLPEIAGFEAGLSGADFWRERNSIILTSSVEATGNSYDDGQILGSFIGVVGIDSLRQDALNDVTAVSHLVQAGGKPIRTKLESIIIRAHDNTSIGGIAVSDNDDGSSDFLHYSLTR